MIIRQTSTIAAAEIGIDAIGIERDRKRCDQAAKSLRFAGVEIERINA